jgi:hypothetical protein
MTAIKVSPYEFDSNLLVVKQVCPFKDDTKRPFANLLAYAIVDADHVAGGRRHGYRE